MDNTAKIEILQANDERQEATLEKISSTVDSSTMRATLAKMNGEA